MSPTSSAQYDVAIIGAGLSGLDSFYSIGGRKYDVGLHAVTNFVPPGVKGTPLGKILRQLRIDREELALRPQKGSRVAFGPGGGVALRFANDFALLESEVATQFPRPGQGFASAAKNRK